MKAYTKIGIALLLLVCWGQLSLAGYTEPGSITVTRWADPTTKPITYDEYMASRTFAESFNPRLVYTSTILSEMDICIVVNENLYPLIQTSLNTYFADLEREGYLLHVYTAANNGDEEALRLLLATEWTSNGISGAFLIGDLPAAWYEMEDWGHEEFPIDLYFMDLDGNWGDADLDGKYDSHDGELLADIWVARIIASNLLMHGGEEVALMINYFDKNHRYRSGAFRLDEHGLAFIDDDWSGYGWEHDLELAYPEVVAVTEPNQTSREEYINQIQASNNNRFEYVFVCAHSSPSLHSFRTSGGTGYFYNSEIESLPVQSLFYNLFACSNARYVENDNMGSWYVFATEYGLLSIGSTKTGAMLNFEDYFGPLGEGQSFGTAFLFWAQENMEEGAGYESRPWFYGMTTLGDPTLKIASHMVYEVAMYCQNLTPVFCRGGSFYFRVTTVNLTGNPVNLTMTFAGYAGRGCDPGNVLITMPRNRTLPEGTNSTNYFLTVPNGVVPGDYSASVSFEYNQETYFCCMDVTIVQCSPWKSGENTSWELVEVERPDLALPTVTELYQNYPNPFNAETNISYSLVEPGEVSLKVYDLSGRLVANLVERYQEAGEHSVAWDASAVSSGVYFYKLAAGDYTLTKKMNLLK
jgi:hypothetical protein